MTDYIKNPLAILLALTAVYLFFRAVKASIKHTEHHVLNKKGAFLRAVFFSGSSISGFLSLIVYTKNATFFPLVIFLLLMFWLEYLFNIGALSLLKK